MRKQKAANTHCVGGSFVSGAAGVHHPGKAQKEHGWGFKLVNSPEELTNSDLRSPQGILR